MRIAYSVTPQRQPGFRSPGVCHTAATAAMHRAGADHAATGENAVVVACRKADIIMGPIGMVIADSLFGEITPVMAAAVGQSSAKRVLIPFNHCDNLIAGVSNTSVSALLQEAVSILRQLADVRKEARIFS